MSDLIATALASAAETDAVVLESGALTQVPQIFAQAYPGASAIVVGDERTMAAAGDRVVAALREAGIEVTTHVFPGEPELYAEYRNIETLREVLRPLPHVPIGVGAGTLNDILKRACGELERTYLLVATAASMDGYTAFGSSIAVDGYKQTLSAPAPRVCVADLDVLAGAPAVMTASGYGDLIGKVTAGADWILADALGVEALDPDVWDLVQGPLPEAVAAPEALAAGDLAAVTNLAEGLVMSGLAMQAHQSSRPASGSEHQFSHLWEMEGHGVDDVPRLSHGAKVGLGTVAIAALYQELLTEDLTALDIEAAVAAWPSRAEMEARVRAHHPDRQLVSAAVDQTLAKWVDGEALRARLGNLAQSWPALAERLRGQIMAPAEIQHRLREVGAPAHPSDIDLDWQRFKDTYVRAQMIRSRYTVLDVALEAGLLTGLVERLFAPDGFWGAQRP